ncbi:MAG: universal stress protein [Gemmatimonadota bacterium]|nr:MAG: universal stress protein [Gemmatimonadota bacterium]
MRIRRIAIAVDASPTSVAALEATVELAAIWDAEVLGIFVEDVNLIKAASLPFAGEVGSHSGAFRRIDPDNVRRQFQSQAARARESLTSAALRRRVTASFRVARGRVNEELLVALSQSDLLSLGKGGKTLAARLGLGSTARAIAASASGHVLFLSHVSQVTGPIAVVHDGSPAGELALAVASDLGHRLNTPVTALCVAGTSTDADELAARVGSAARETGYDIRCRHCTLTDARDLARLARFNGANMVVIPAHSAVLSDRVVEGVVKDFFGPVLLAAGPN